MRRDRRVQTGDRRRRERGSALVEFTIGALVFMTATFGVLEFSRLLWTHNALSDATRRAARWAVNEANPADAPAEARAVDPDAVKRMVVYGNPEGTGNPVVSGLDISDVDVAYTPSPVTGYFSYPEGSVTVTISDFEFRFIVPIIGGTITLPDYRTTLTAESSGMAPPDITPSPTPTPSATPTPSPTPRSCERGENVSTGCVCQAPMRVNGAGKCQ